MGKPCVVRSGRLTQRSQGHPGTSLRAYNNPLGRPRPDLNSVKVKVKVCCKSEVDRSCDEKFV
jgi:hypothetical protein